MKDFRDRVAVITGGASGIGLGIARAFASRGAKLVIADLDVTALHEVVESFRRSGTDIIGSACDVSQLEQVEALESSTHYS